MFENTDQNTSSDRKWERLGFTSLILLIIGLLAIILSVATIDLRNASSLQIKFFNLLGYIGFGMAVISFLVGASVLYRLRSFQKAGMLPALISTIIGGSLIMLIIFSILSDLFNTVE